MNGNAISALVWIANGLITLLLLVVGFAVKQHMESDKEHRERVEKELDLLRSRVHDAGNRIAEALTRLRWRDEDTK